MELLEVVYPSHKAISADNVEYLLDLGDKFQIQVSGRGGGVISFRMLKIGKYLENH